MGKNATQSLGARGRQDAHMFYPEDLTLVVSERVDPEIQKLADSGHLTLLVDPTHFLFDRRADLPPDRDLSISLKIEGCLQPIRIMRDGQRKVVVLGRQRLKAAALHNSTVSSEAEFIRLPSMIYRADEVSAFKALVAENEQRVQDPPVLRAEKMQQALNQGIGKEEVCRLFRIGAQQLSNMLRLLECAPEVRKAVDKGEITATLAYTQIAKLDRPQQIEALKELKDAGVTKGNAASEAVAERRNGKAEGDPPQPRAKAPRRKELERWVGKLKGQKDPFIRGVRVALMKALGMNPKGWNEVKAVLEPEE